MESACCTRLLLVLGQDEYMSGHIGSSEDVFFSLTGGLFDVLVAEKAPVLLFNPFLGVFFNPARRYTWCSKYCGYAL